jgi:hypothetical protein
VSSPAIPQALALTPTVLRYRLVVENKSRLGGPSANPSSIPGSITPKLAELLFICASTRTTRTTCTNYQHAFRQTTWKDGPFSRRLKVSDFVAD